MHLTRNRPVLRMVICGVCLALYFVLSIISVNTQVIKLTIDALPVIFVAIVCGPVDGMAVGLLGSFFAQLYLYGLTVTTPLWILPAAIRGLIVGLMFRNKDVSKHMTSWILTVIISGLIVTGINTFVIYLDAKIFNYPSQITYVSSIMRILTNIATSIIYIYLVPLLARALVKAGVLKVEEEKEKEVK